LKSYPYLQRELHKRNENSSLPSQEVNKAPWLTEYNRCLKPAFWTPLALAYNPSYSGGRNQEDHSLNKEFLTPYLEKNPIQKRIVRVAQVIQHLPIKCEALSSNTSTDKKQKKNCFCWKSDSFLGPSDVLRAG
jgi:hypothetical protein